MDNPQGGASSNLTMITSKYLQRGPSTTWVTLSWVSVVDGVFLVSFKFWSESSHKCIEVATWGTLMYLVGGLEPWHFMTFHRFFGNVIIPSDELHHFSRGVSSNHPPVIYDDTEPQRLHQWEPLCTCNSRPYVWAYNTVHIYIYICTYIYIYLYVYLQRCTDICMWVRLSKHMYVIFNSIYIDMFLCRLLFFCTYHGMQATIRPKRGHMLHLPGNIRQLGLSVNCSQHRSTRSTGSPQGKMTYPAW